MDSLRTHEELSHYPAVRQRRWAAMVHRPFDEAALTAIRRSNETGLPYGDGVWVQRLAKKLDLDLTIRPRGRPREVPDPTEDI